jgi:hypothetical protein
LIWYPRARVKQDKRTRGDLEPSSRHAQGWAALSGGDWERARASFEESLTEGETPEALEGMGWVGHMLNEDRLTFDARERAYPWGSETRFAFCRRV